MIERLAPEQRLRLCVVGDFDGEHTRSWLRYFVARGHEVHGVSYYAPTRTPEGVELHVLKPGSGGATGRARSAGRRLPQNLQRVASVLRYRRAGLARVVHAIAPDVLHAHYLVEHGLYATVANYHPYVVSAWGSDVLVEPERSWLSRAMARFVLRRADMATANNRHMLREMILKLGAERAWAQHIVLGVERDFLSAPGDTVNARAPAANRTPTVISTRSLDTPLYNVDTILRAMARARERVAARLVVAGDGRLRPQLEALARKLGLGDAVAFIGSVPQDAFRRALVNAEVFVSVPSSDATSVALLQAMGVGCFPIVSDLPSQQELVEHGVAGLRAPVRDETALADAIVRALEGGELRRTAAERNRAFVEEYGLQETNMARMEAWYYRLAGRAEDAPVS